MNPNQQTRNTMPANMARSMEQFLGERPHSPIRQAESPHQRPNNLSHSYPKPLEPPQSEKKEEYTFSDSQAIDDFVDDIAEIRHENEFLKKTVENMKTAHHSTVGKYQNLITRMDAEIEELRTNDTYIKRIESDKAFLEELVETNRKKVYELEKQLQQAPQRIAKQSTGPICGDFWEDESKQAYEKLIRELAELVKERQRDLEDSQRQNNLFLTDLKDREDQIEMLARKSMENSKEMKDMMMKNFELETLNAELKSRLEDIKSQTNKLNYSDINNISISMSVANDSRPDAMRPDTSSFINNTTNTTALGKDDLLIKISKKDLEKTMELGKKNRELEKRSIRQFDKIKELEFQVQNLSQQKLMLEDAKAKAEETSLDLKKFEVLSKELSSKNQELDRELQNTKTSLRNTEAQLQHIQAESLRKKSPPPVEEKRLLIKDLEEGEGYLGHHPGRSSSRNKAPGASPLPGGDKRAEFMSSLVSLEERASQTLRQTEKETERQTDRERTRPVPLEESFSSRYDILNTTDPLGMADRMLQELRNKQG